MAADFLMPIPHIHWKHGRQRNAYWYCQFSPLGNRNHCNLKWLSKLNARFFSFYCAFNQHYDSPEDLLKRLLKGKIYFPELAEFAKENFFRIGNLIALRELALRATAERAGKETLLYRQGHGIKQIWPTREKILVCVGSSTTSIKVIRAAKRMSVSLQAEWIAVHIDTPHQRLSEEQRNKAILNLRSAEQLGAETRILTGVNVVKELMNFAREQNITKIVMEKKSIHAGKIFYSAVWLMKLYVTVVK